MKLCEVSGFFLRVGTPAVLAGPPLAPPFSELAIDSLSTALFDVVDRVLLGYFLTGCCFAAIDDTVVFLCMPSLLDVALGSFAGWAAFGLLFRLPWPLSIALYPVFRASVRAVFCAVAVVDCILLVRMSEPCVDLWVWWSGYFTEAERLPASAASF